jgi:ligand-binding SRPBCC domain-containing protein
VLRREQLLPLPRAAVFPFFVDPRNLERLTPPLLQFRVTGLTPGEVGTGTLIQYRLRLHGLPVDWLTRIEDWEPGVRFVDNQLSGPYRLWHHTHEFEDHPRGTLMRDTVRYSLPAWPLGELAHPLVRRDLRLIFDFREAAAADFIK